MASMLALHVREPFMVGTPELFRLFHALRFG